MIILDCRLKYQIIFLLLLILVSNCYAQKSKADKYYTNNSRHWCVEIPLWVPSFRGEFAYGDIEFSSSGSKEEKEYDRLNSKSNIEFYFVGRVAAKYNRFWFQLDAFSGKVGSTFTWDPIVGDDQKELLGVNVQGILPRFAAGYYVWEKQINDISKIGIVPYLGLRYIYVDLHAAIFDSLVQEKLDTDWFEPLIGLYIPYSYRRFKAEFITDCGITNRKLSWSFNVAIRYRLSRVVDVKMGWNYLQLNHKGTVGEQNLNLRLWLSGPGAGIGFRF